MITATEPARPVDTLTIAGSVDPGSGDIQTELNVVVRGDVTDARIVRGERDITIDGSVDNARVEAGGRLAIGGGAIGRDRCRCLAGGSICVRHVNGATLEAGGDLTVEANVIQARLICGGRLRIAEGSFNGGYATAGGDVICRNLGSSSGIATIIEAGLDETLRRLAAGQVPDLETQVERLQAMRAESARLVRNQKILTREEKEKATELLYEIEELAQDVESKLAALRARRDEAQTRPAASVAVSGVIHAGVVIRLGGLEAQIQSPLKGPLVLARQRIGGTSVIAMAEPGAKAWHPLNTMSFRDAAIERLTRILSDKK